MSTWLSDMLSATPFGSMNLMYNQCYADSTARWYMNNPLVNNFMFTPYSFNMGLNPEFVWYQTGFNMFNNAGAWNIQQPFSPWGWYQQTTNNNSNSNTTDPEQKAENEKYTQQYTKLQNLLKGILILNDGTDGDNFLGTKLDAEIAKCAKEKTPKEKYEALKKVYEAYCKEYDIKESDIQAYLEKCSLEISIGISESKKATIHELLRQSGYKGFNVTKNTQTAVNNIDSQINALGNPQGDLSALNISETDVLAVISAYNDTNGDLIDNVMKAVNGISDPQQRGTAESGVKSLITALTSRANDLKDSKYLDKDSKDKITTAIEKLNKEKIVNSEGFKKAFNDLYVLTRLANARIIEKSLNNQFGFLKQGIGGFVTENTIEDLKKEKIKTSGIDSLKSQINIAESTGRRHSDGIKEEDTPQQQIEKLEEAGYIEKVDGAKVDERQVYKVVADGSYIILGTDDKIYKVTKTNDSYTAEANTVKAKDIEAAGKKAKARKELEEDLAKLSGIPSETIGDNTVYTIKIAGKDFKFIIDGDNKIREVEVADDEVTVQSSGAMTLDALKQKIDEANTPKFSIKVGNLKNEIMSCTAISQGNWNACDSDFKKGLENCLQGIKDAYDAHRDYYSQEEWDNAYEATINYYKDALGSLCTVNWNKLYEKDQTKSIEVDSYADKDGRTCNFQCYIDRTGENVDSYVELKNRNKSDSTDTDIYVGCDWDSWFRNEFYIYINTDRAVEKFKSFLPK